MLSQNSLSEPAQIRREVHCCIAGGGPAGMMLGFLLARAGVEVLVLEKHADFLRDFRGDTVHPSTLELMCELGILDAFLHRPHQELRQIGGLIGDFEVTIADFSHLPTHCKFIALMPQWDFLNFIAQNAKAYPQFQLCMQAEVIDLLVEKGRIDGVRANIPEGTIDVRAYLTIGADGRHSVVREKAKLPVHDLGAPIDVLWMRVSRRLDDPEQTLGRFRQGKILVTLNRDRYWQCAYVIAKGEFEDIKQKGLPVFRKTIETIAPFLRGRTEELKTWDNIKLLSVAVDRLRQWSRPRLLCIGDSAHAMSPIGGVGINLAIQDAVAAANILAEPLLNNAVTDRHLHAIQERREFPTKMTQRFQIFAHKRFINPAMSRQAPLQTLPLPLQLLKHFPSLRQIPARILGVGFRPEHIRTRDVNKR